MSGVNFDGPIPRDVYEKQLCEWTRCVEAWRDRTLHAEARLTQARHVVQEIRDEAAPLDVRLIRSLAREALSAIDAGLGEQ